MKTALQLLTGTQLELPKKLAQQADPEWKVEAVDLTRKEVDYREVLQKIFAVDSIQVW
jgi:hypothetical protein